LVKKEFLTQIQKDFAIVTQNKEILGILLYGSYVEDNQTSRSDIDICVVAPDENDGELFSYILQNVNVVLKKYDVRLFSELPLYIKIQIIEKGIVIFSPDELDLYEFFYIYRKLWADQEHRQKITKEELLSF